MGFYGFFDRFKRNKPEASRPVAPPPLENPLQYVTGASVGFHLDDKFILKIHTTVHEQNHLWQVADAVVKNLSHQYPDREFGLTLAHPSIGITLHMLPLNEEGIALDHKGEVAPEDREALDKVINYVRKMGGRQSLHSAVTEQELYERAFLKISRFEASTLGSMIEVHLKPDSSRGGEPQPPEILDSVARAITSKLAEEHLPVSTHIVGNKILVSSSINYSDDDKAARILDALQKAMDEAKGIDTDKATKRTRLR